MKLLVAIVFGLLAFNRADAESKFHVTDEERIACTRDAVTWCSEAYPDEDKLLACMKAKRDQLSAGCRPIFDAGIKRRHLQ